MTTNSLDPERSARAILEKFKVGDRLPIDVESLARSLGVSIKFEPFDSDLSGVLVKESARTLIGVNSSHPVTRQRFTIAHELGHFVLRHEGEVFVDKTLRNRAMVVRRDGKSSLGQDLYEIQANQFAAELLMPKALVTMHLAKRLEKRARTATGVLVAELAATFLVSTQAMEYRLTNLGSLALA